MINTIANGNIIHSLSQNIASGITGLSIVPRQVTRIIKEDMWKRYVVKPTGEEVTYNNFREFLETPLPKGLGISVDDLKRLCGNDPELLTSISEVTTLKQGGNNNPKGSNQHFEIDEEPEEVKHDIIMLDLPKKAPQGTSKEYGLRRLKKETPELHEAVVRGDKSVHEACVEAGFRKKPSPVKTAQEAVKKMSEKELQDFKEWLNQYER
jgi:hypothetical protein